MKTTPARVIRKGAEAEEAWLASRGYDGLACVLPGNECGCGLNDLYPCGERGERDVCVPAHYYEAGFYAEEGR